MKYNSFIVRFHKYDWLCHLATFLCQPRYKGGQITKPIILVKTCYKIIEFYSGSLEYLSVIGDFFASADIKAFGCIYVGRTASYWPCTFLHPRCFCLAYIYIYIYIYIYVTKIALT